MYVCRYTYRLITVSMHVRMYIYIYIYVCIHILHIHIYIHTYICKVIIMVGSFKFQVSLQKSSIKETIYIRKVIIMLCLCRACVQLWVVLRSYKGLCTTDGGDWTYNNYCQNFKPFFTAVPVTFKQVFTGVPTISNRFSWKKTGVP